MTKRSCTGLLAMLAVVALTSSTPSAQTPAASATTEGIRQALLNLPYYGVFDFLAFSYDKGTVTLEGYAYRLGLKADAERAIKRVAGVDQVVNNVEELPVSPNDDDIRWSAYYAIYGDPFLSRYAPGGGMLWGHRHSPRRSFSGGPARFANLEPAGDYPIHIVVKGGRITLLGVVDNEADKNVAGLRANGVPGAFGVENQLMIERR